LRKLNQRILELPEFCSDYFIGIEQTTGEKTRLGYASDLMIFFTYLLDFEPWLAGKTIHDLELADLERVTPTDIERFLNHVTYYTKTTDDQTELDRQNGEKGKARKLAAIRSMYKYFYKRQMIQGNPAMLVSTPKIHDKNIIRLDSGETARLLDEVESGDKLTKRQQTYHRYTGLRDVALITTLLGTGIRISECVGLDIKDVDFDNNGLRIIRKGGNESIVYFGDEVRKALLDYLVERRTIEPMPGHEEALFLSMQKKRLSVRAIQNLVDKYSKTINSLKHISPHKLRSTYGTALYNETGDIYLVADVLGHKDVNTTRKHYAHLEEERRRLAAKAVKLREDEP
jgi:site-specific recombinase XerD